MADHLGALQQVVQEAIDDERLGQPQFVRCVARAQEGGSLDSSLEVLASMGESWFGAPAASRTRRGRGQRRVPDRDVDLGHGPGGAADGERHRRERHGRHRPDGRRQPRHTLPPSVRL